MMFINAITSPDGCARAASRTLGAVLGGLCLSLSLSSAAQAQRADTSRSSVAVASTDSDRVIRIALPGEVRLHSWSAPRVEVRVQNIRSGRVMGFRNEAARTPYAVHVTADENGIEIVPIERAVPVTVGFSTLHESLRHDLYLPSNARICVQANGSPVDVEGAFRELDVLTGDARAPVHFHSAGLVHPTSSAACAQTPAER